MQKHYRHWQCPVACVSCDARKTRRSDVRDGKLHFRWLDAVSRMREQGQFLPLASKFMFAYSLLGRLGRSLFGCSGKRMFRCPWMVKRDELGIGPRRSLCCTILSISVRWFAWWFYLVTNYWLIDLPYTLVLSCALHLCVRHSCDANNKIKV